MESPSCRRANSADRGDVDQWTDAIEPCEKQASLATVIKRRSSPMPVCPLCPGRYFVDDNAVRMHRESKHDYSCGHCDRVLNSQQALDQHIRDKHSFDCRHCDRNFHSEESRQQHEDTKHSTVECRYCDREFNSEEARQQHENAKHAFECRHCGRNFHSEEARQQHEDAKHGSIECRYCDREFNSEEAREQHENAKHVFECRHCDRSFNSEEARWEHEDTKHSAIECRHCDREFNSEEAREQHENAKHAFKCRHCDCTFYSEDVRELHEDADHSTFECRYCGREFSSEGALGQHTEAKHYSRCNLCGKTFLQLAQLRHHELTVPHFECSYCERGLFTRALKEAHEASCYINPVNLYPKLALSDQSGSSSIHPGGVLSCPTTQRTDGESTAPSSTTQDKDKGGVFCSTNALPTDANDGWASIEQCCVGTSLLEPCSCSVCRRTSSVSLDTDKPVSEDDESVGSSDESHQNGSEGHRDITFQCTPCLTLFENEEAFRQHVCAFRTAMPRPHCSVCYSQFDDEPLLQKHLEGLELFSCQICPARCCSDEMLRDHLLSHPTCGKCGKSFVNSLVLCAHVESDHPVVVCWDCDGIVVEMNDLEAHYAESRAHPTCGLCGVGTRNSAEMGAHLRHVHPGVEGGGDVTVGARIMTRDESSQQSQSEEFERTPLPADAEIGGPDGESNPSSPQTKAAPIVDGEEGVPSPTPSEHGSSASQTALLTSKATITATNNDTRPPSPASSGSVRSFFDLSTRSSPSSSSSNSVVFVSADGIPEYVRENRAVLVATSGGSPSSGRTPLRLSSSSSLASGPSGTREDGAGYRLHCRICRRDPCEDMTATLCGHLFCRRCITQAVVAKSECPACGSATLLYCLFKLDLSV